MRRNRGQAAPQWEEVPADLEYIHCEDTIKAIWPPVRNAIQRKLGETANGSEKVNAGYYYCLSIAKALTYPTGCANLYEGAEMIFSAVYDILSSLRITNGKLSIQMGIDKGADGKPGGARKRPFERGQDGTDMEIGEDEGLQSPQSKAAKLDSSAGASAAPTAAPKEAKRPPAVPFRWEDPLETIQGLRYKRLKIPYTRGENKAPWTVPTDKYNAATQFCNWRENAELGVMCIPMTELIKSVVYILKAGDTVSPELRDKDKGIQLSDMDRKYIAIVQGLGRMSDGATRYESLMYSKHVHIYGTHKFPPTYGFLTLRGSKLSKVQLTKFATSQDAGTILRAIGLMNGKKKKKNAAPDKKAEDNKRRQLVAALYNRCIHPAQQYIVKQLLKKDFSEREAVMLLIRSWLVAKPKANACFIAPLAYWDGSNSGNYETVVDMFMNRVPDVKTAFPQLPWLSLTMMVYEDIGVISASLGEKLNVRSQYTNTTTRFAKSRTYSIAVKPQWVFPPLKGSPSDAGNVTTLSVGGVTARIERENKDRIDPDALLADEAYASVDAAMTALKLLISKGPTRTEVSGQTRAYPKNSAGVIDWENPENNKKVETLGGSFMTGSIM